MPFGREIAVSMPKAFLHLKSRPEGSSGSLRLLPVVFLFHNFPGVGRGDRNVSR